MKTFLVCVAPASGMESEYIAVVNGGENAAAFSVITAASGCSTRTMAENAGWTVVGVKELRPNTVLRIGD